MSAFTHEKLRKNQKKKEKAEKSAFLGSPAVGKGRVMGVECIVIDKS